MMHTTRIFAMLVAASAILCAVGPVALHAAPSPASGSSAAPLTADQASVLDLVRTYSLEYTRKLPDFICTQMTHREATILSDAASHVDANTILAPNTVESTDIIEEQLTYFSQAEHYQVIAINHKKVTGVQHTQIAGAVSAGEFGSQLHDLFTPNSKTVFTWSKMGSLRGRNAYIYAFQVPKQAGIHISDKFSHQEIDVGYGGFIFVDAETKEVLRITSKMDLPPKFAIVSAERLADYRPATIAGKDYNLPFHSEVRMKDSSRYYVNEIDYKSYHKFTTDSVLSFNTPEESNKPGQPSSQPKPVPAGAEIAAANPTSVAAPVSTPVPAPQQPVSTQTVQQPVQPVAAAQQQPPAQLAAGAEMPAAPSQPAQPAEPEAHPAAQPADTFAPPAPALNTASAADSSFQLKASVDLVMVPVVVRDGSGKAVGTLTKDDFQIFDKGKRQAITSFTMETKDGPSKAPADEKAVPASPARNFIIYFFDDTHLKQADLAPVREAAEHSMDMLVPTDRAAIMTTSGLTELHFTTDRAMLHEALLKLRPHPPGGARAQGCPDVTYYMADEMLNRNNPSDYQSNLPLQAATAEAIACMGLSPNSPGATQVAENQTVSAAMRALTVGEQGARDTLRAFKEVIHWVSPAPGEKNIVLVSPGFVLGSGLEFEESDVVDEAIRGGVVINALDARGLYVVDAAGSAEDRFADAGATRIKAGLARDEAKASSGLLETMAGSTGGTLIQNTNDLSGGFRRLVTAPEFTYLLGFKPEKTDGKFHPLKVQLTAKGGLTSQARKGYFAPKK